MIFGDQEAGGSGREIVLLTAVSTGSLHVLDLWVGGEGAECQSTSWTCGLEVKGGVQAPELDGAVFRARAWSQSGSGMAPQKELTSF